MFVSNLWSVNRIYHKGALGITLSQNEYVTKLPLFFYQDMTDGSGAEIQNDIRYHSALILVRQEFNSSLTMHFSPHPEIYCYSSLT